MSKDEAYNAEMWDISTKQLIYLTNVLSALVDMSGEKRQASRIWNIEIRKC